MFGPSFAGIPGVDQDGYQTLIWTWLKSGIFLYQWHKKLGFD
jgi:hypothetical protein